MVRGISLILTMGDSQRPRRRRRGDADGVLWVCAVLRAILQRIGKGTDWEADGLGKGRIVASGGVVGVSYGVRAGRVQRMFMIDISLPQ